MKFAIVTKLLNIFLAILLLFVVITVGIPHKAEAADPPPPPPDPAPAAQTPEQCIGKALATYMNAITAERGEGAGKIPSNVKLLSPAFNMTSYTFPGIAQGMKDAGAKFNLVDGIAGNVYNTNGQGISVYMEAVRTAFPGGPFMITETGTMDHSTRGINELAAELEKLRTDKDITGALLFNGLGTNNGWRQHSFTSEQIKVLCGGTEDCSGRKLGANTANMFGYTPETYYKFAQSFRMSYSLEIADSGQMDNTEKGINLSIKYGITPIIRIGVGGSAGAFTDPAAYVAFLSDIGHEFGGTTIYAIAGPNEPDLENWLTPECPTISVPAGGGMCVGPVDVDETTYRGQVIGHQDPDPDSGKGPWRIIVSATGDAEDKADLVTEVIRQRMQLTPSAYNYTDFSTLSEKFVGSTATTDPDFITNKVEGLYDRSKESRSPPVYLVSHIPGFVQPGGVGIQPTPEIKPKEPYPAFQDRAYPSQDGVNPGKKATIDKFEAFKGTVFVGCLQSAVCNPQTEKCLHNDKRSSYCAKDGDDSDCFCGPDDDPKGCIGMGSLINFKSPTEGVATDDDKTAGPIGLIEPATLQTMDKAMWDFSAAIARKPADTVPKGRSAIMATSLEDYYAQENEIMAKADIPKDVKQQIMASPATENIKPENITVSYAPAAPADKNPLKPTSAQAQESPPYDPAQDYCSGAHILIENKKDENQFGVKIWNGQPDCPQVVDWAYYVEYWVGNDDVGYQEVGTCGDPAGSNLHQSAGLPNWKPDGADEEKYGVSVGDLLGCSVPVTPRDLEGTGMQLKVHFQISGGRVPNPESGGGNGSCTQYPVCTCPNEDACGLSSPPKKLPPLDCSVCETWAPAGECATMVAEDLESAPSCAKGHCEIKDGVHFGLAGPQDAESGGKITDVGSNILISIIDTVAGWLNDWLPPDLTFYNMNCHEDTTCDVAEVNGHCPDGHDHEKWYCTWGERQYLLYGYFPAHFKGKLNAFRTNYDFLAFQALYKVPGFSESYFDLKPSKQTLSINLGLGGTNVDNDGKSDACEKTLGERLDIFHLSAGDDSDSCLSTKINGDTSRTIYIEYLDHYSQAAQYCLGEAALSRPNEFPNRPLALCAPFMNTLRGGGFLTAAPGGKTSLTPTAIKLIENDSLELGVPASLLTTILEIEGGSQDSCTRPDNPSDTGTGPYQITDDLAIGDSNGNGGLASPDEAKAWNLQRWAPGTPQSLYRKDGRCDFKIATLLAARAVKVKAGVDKLTGTISSNDFDTIRAAFNGYYGQAKRFCESTSDTEGRSGWGEGISYCDYGLWRMGLTQYCKDGKLSPSCDNTVYENAGGDISSNPTTTQTTMTPVSNTISPTTNPQVIDAQKALIQKQLLADLEVLLNKYSKDKSLDIDTPVNQMPPEFRKELENLHKKYQEKFNL